MAQSVSRIGGIIILRLTNCLEERLLNFAVAMVKMSTELPRNTAGFEIGKQIALPHFW
jgi:hypothetical protein